MYTFYAYSVALGKIRDAVPTNKVVERVIHIFVKTCILIPLILVTSFVWLDIDPLYVLRETRIFQDSFYILFPLQIIIYTWLCAVAVTAVCGLITVSPIILQGSIQIIARWKKVSEKWDTSPILVLKVYKELQIWNRYVNQNYCYLAGPPITFFGMCTLVFCNYATIRFPGRLPLSVFWLVPVTSSVGFILLMTILPPATQVWESSLKLLGVLKWRCFSKYELRVFRSVNAVGIAIGPFGHATQSWMVAILWNIVNYSINLLLTF